jgi:hypothetical protein
MGSMNSQKLQIALLRYQNWLLEQTLFVGHAPKEGPGQLVKVTAAAMDKARKTFGLPCRVCPDPEA